MSNQNKPPLDEFYSKEQEKVIRRSFDNYEKKLGITKETPEYLKQSFERKLASLSEPKKKFVLRWRGLIVSIATAFSVGVLITRFLMLPGTVATRGVGGDGDVNQMPSAQEYLSIRVSNPKEFTFEVISAALEADMDVEITRAGEKYGLHIKSFKNDFKSQEKIRSMLGVKAETTGVVNIVIGKAN